MTDESGLTEYRYDAFGNMIEKKHTELGHTYTTSNSYDTGNQLASMTLPSGRVITLARDAIRRIESITSPINGVDTALVSNIQYRADYQMTQCTYGNDIVDNRNYDLQGRLVDQSLTTSVDTIIDQRQYDYDLNSNIISRQTTTQNNQYEYDPLDRLITNIPTSNDTHYYGYDQNNNRERGDSNDLSSAYQYIQDSNRLELLETHKVGDTAFDPLAERQLVYNDAGRLFQLYENGMLIGTYTYNAYGQRTRKETTDGITLYHYSQGQLVSETHADGRSIKDYIRQNGELIAQIDVTGTTDQISYIHTDHLSTPRLATDSNETIVWKWEGEAFGKEPAQSSGVDVNIRFPGQYFDFESGLFYNYYRYYDPSTGRYITSDPIGLWGGLNTYGYVSGNPLMYTDPTGQNAITAGRGAFLAGSQIGAVINAGIQAATGASLGVLIYDALNDNIYNAKPVKGDLETDGPDGPFSWVEPDRLTNNDKLKGDWENENGQDWPIDPDTGKDMDASHEIPLGDGGPDHVSNIEPRSKKDHKKRHRDPRDHSRWSKRKGKIFDNQICPN